MKITVERDNSHIPDVVEKFSIEVSEESTLSEMLDVFERILKMLTYCYDGNLVVYNEETDEFKCSSEDHYND
jgi:hypothetical protein